MKKIDPKAPGSALSQKADVGDVSAVEKAMGCDMPHLRNDGKRGCKKTDKRSVTHKTHGSKFNAAIAKRCQ